VAKLRAWTSLAARAGVVLTGTLLLGVLLATPLASAAASAAADPTPPAASAAADPTPPAASTVRGTGLHDPVARTDVDLPPALGVPRVASTPAPVSVQPSPVEHGSRRTNLPATGLDVGGMLTLGSTLVVAGVLMLALRRRGERSTLAVLPPEASHIWHAPTQELPYVPVIKEELPRSVIN
jgi:hypothetical protein